MVEYDVLGNERHKTICKLREMPKLYPNKDGGADLYAWKHALADAIGADCYAPDAMATVHFAEEVFA